MCLENFREKQARRLATTWLRRKVNVSKRDLLIRARRSIDYYSRHADYMQNKLNIPFEMMLVEVIDPTNDDFLAFPPMNPLAFIEKFWTNKCLRCSDKLPTFSNAKLDDSQQKLVNEGFHNLEVLSLKELKLADCVIASRPFNARQWKKLFSKQDISIKKLSVCYFAAMIMSRNLKGPETAPAVAKCIAERISDRKSETFRRLRAFLNDLIDDEMLNSLTASLPRVSEKGVKRLMESSGGFGLAVEEDNATILQLLYKCVDRHLKQQTFPHQRKNAKHLFRKMETYGQMAASRNQVQVLKEMAKIILAEGLILAMGDFHLPPPSTSGSDEESELFYFGVKVGRWDALLGRNRWGSTIFHQAAEEGKKELVECLIRLVNEHQLPSNLLLALDNFHRSPLHWASRNSHGDIVVIILNYAEQAKYDESLTGIDLEGKTPCDYTKRKNIRSDISNFCKCRGNSNTSTPNLSENSTI